MRYFRRNLRNFLTNLQPTNIAKLLKDSTARVLSFGHPITTLGVTALLLIVTLPIVAITMRVSFAKEENWEHFKTFLLPDALLHTTILVGTTVLLAGTLGMILATIVALYDFPFKKLIKGLLYIPIAIPPYIAAYVLAGMFSYTGTLQRTLRVWEIPHSPQWFDVMTLPGAIAIYTFTLYPYIYGAVKSYLEHHSSTLIEVSRTLGYRPITLLFRVLVPLVRIPLVGGSLLVAMEVISDYGVVQYFNIITISTVIFRSWFGMGQSSIALRLAFYVMLGVIAIQTFEERLRGRRKYHLPSGRPKPLTPTPLKGIKGYTTSFLLIAFISIIFFVPVGQMIYWASLSLALKRVPLIDMGTILLNTLMYSGIATVLIILINIALAHSNRWLPKNLQRLLSKVSQLGYSMPGAIIAIGTISLFVALDQTLRPLYLLINPNAKVLVLSTSLVMLIYAFVIRYMAVGYNGIHSAFTKVGTRFNDAARVLGYPRTKALLLVELPMLKGAIFSSFLLTFIDIMKELPLTLMLRPFNYNTLASKAYEYANDERIHEASVPALIIVGFSLLAVLLFIKTQSKKGGSSHGPNR